MADPLSVAPAAPAATLPPRGASVAALSPRDTSVGTRLLLACGIAGPVIFWILGIAAAAVRPGYDPVSDSISALAVGPESWLQTDALILIAVLSIAFAIGMGRVAGATLADRSAVRSLLLLLAVIELGFALFPMDAGPRDRTLHGALHTAVLGAFAVAFPAAAYLIARILRRDPPWWRAGVLTDIVAVVMAIAIVGVVLVEAGPLAPWTGLLERIWVAVPTLWLAGLAAHGMLVTAGRFRGPAGV